ncbi:MAG: 50S ribosomal protein L22 [Acidobacteriaceae bacterium]
MAQEIREFRAEARFQRVSPQKAKLVLDLIKGQRVEQALNTVAFTRKRIAPLVEKVLRSAVQNANYLSQEQDLDVDVDNLFVKTAVANEGPRMKRIRPAPMGRAFRYQRRLAHIIVTVAERRPADLVTTVGEDGQAAQSKKNSGSKTLKAARKPAAKTAKPASRPAKTKAAASRGAKGGVPKASMNRRTGSS